MSTRRCRRAGHRHVADGLASGRDDGQRHSTDADRQRGVQRPPLLRHLRDPDGLVILAANTERQFKLLCDAIGRADSLDDVRFATPVAQHDHVDALRAEFAAEFNTRGAAEWEEILDRAGVPGVRVRRMDEVLAEAQLAARSLLQPVGLTGVARGVAVPSLGFKANGQTVAPDMPPALLVANTEAVLGALGLDSQALRAAGAI